VTAATQRKHLGIDEQPNGKRAYPEGFAFSFQQESETVVSAFVVHDQVSGEDERLDERHALIPLDLSNAEPSEGFGAQAQHLMLARIATVLPGNEDVELAIEAAR
jgi:hypothetical protein